MNLHYRFYGNLHTCPVGRRKADCPISALENLTFGEKVIWFDNLSFEERNLVEEHHKNCVAMR